MEITSNPGEKSVVPLDSQACKSKTIVKGKNVLDEDEFTEGISTIIERDFFPDLPKLEAQAEYFEAMEKNDLNKLQEIQKRFRRPDTAISNAAANTPATFETPVGREATPASKGRPPTEKPRPQTASEELEEDMESFDFDSKGPKGNLDSFLSKNTSEDSASFAEILKEAEQKHRLKYAWLFGKEQELLAEHNDMLALPSVEEQAAITDKPSHLNTWKYVNQNSVMYIPDGEELSAAELIDDQKNKPRQIIHANTRFQVAPFSSNKSKEAMAKAASFKALINSGKIGHDGKEIQEGQSPSVNGYGFVKTPSPAPGVQDSPLMTWGELDSTPARLDVSDTPSGTPGPIFRIPDVPKRDKLALELSEKASKAHRDKKQAALQQVTRRFASPSPSAKFSMTSTERVNSLSPAAQRLVSKRLGIRVSTDKALQESYSPSPSPSHRLPGTKTPTRLTPGSKRSRTSLPGSPAMSTPGSQRGAGNSTPTNPSLTDHLLHLPNRKRKTASDFF